MTPHPELTGQLGRYVIVRKLGAGGMGTVYLAEDTRLPRKVALKVPHFTAADGTALERFRREAALAAGIDHPNLCPVHDLEEIDGILFFTMPFLEGTPLSHLIERDKPWPVSKAAELVRKIAGAVVHLHAHGIIHRDLKPSNVMVRPSGEPVLMDFGLARDFISQDVRLTSSRTAMGSPAYMSPEQVAGQLNMGPGVDVYGLGLILFELLTGRLPFDAPVPALYVQIQHDAPPPLSRFRPALHAQMDALCLKTLSKEPGARQPNVEAFLQELARAVACGASRADGATEALMPFPLTTPPDQNILQTAATQALPPSRPAPRRVSKWLLAILLLLLLAIPGAWFLIDRGTTREPNRNDNRLPAEKKDARPGQARTPFDAKTAKELQQAWANHLKRPVEEEFDLGEGVKLTVVLIPPGTFRMGLAPEKERGEEPQEREIPEPFYLGKYEVTQEQYWMLMNEYPSEFSEDGGGKDKVKGMETKRFPVESVRWEEAVQCCEALGRKLRRKVELPSEAKWEYACRGGTETAFHFGDTLNGAEANCNGTIPQEKDQKAISLGRTCEVGSYPANAWGLYDMHGNVWEWCQDRYKVLGPPTEGVKDNEWRILRGGSWNTSPLWCRSGYRSGYKSALRYSTVGFRVAVRLE